jgi:hypothetical protein
LIIKPALENKPPGAQIDRLIADRCTRLLELEKEAIQANSRINGAKL